MSIPKPRKLRLRRSYRKQSRRRPINVLASAMTAANLYCGIASIFAAISGDLQKSAYFIIAGIVFDTLDGSVARLTNSISEFGKQLDSLCDVVSFGAAPAVLIYVAYVREAPQLIEGIGSMIATIYVISGALRLARYNVYQSERRDYFTGLPIPAAGATVASLVLFTEYLALDVKFWVIGPLTLVLALLMVSTVRYPKDRMKTMVLAPRSAFRLLAILVFVFAAFDYARQYSPTIILFAIMMGYVVLGIAGEVYTYLTRRPHHVSEPLPLEPSDEEPLNT